eukprot:436729-Rhodomonas_salina.1
MLDQEMRKDGEEGRERTVGGKGKWGGEEREESGRQGEGGRLKKRGREAGASGGQDEGGQRKETDLGGHVEVGHRTLFEGGKDRRQDESLAEPGAAHDEGEEEDGERAVCAECREHHVGEVGGAREQHKERLDRAQKRRQRDVDSRRVAGSRVCRSEEDEGGPGKDQEGRAEGDEDGDELLGGERDAEDVAAVGAGAEHEVRDAEQRAEVERVREPAVDVEREDGNAGHDAEHVGEEQPAFDADPAAVEEVGAVDAEAEQPLHGEEGQAEDLNRERRHFGEQRDRRHVVLGEAVAAVGEDAAVAQTPRRLLEED